MMEGDIVRDQIHSYVSSHSLVERPTYIIIEVSQ